MVIKLTHKGKPTLVNVNHIVSVYMDTDLKCGEYKAKLNFQQGVLFVDEELAEVHKLMNQAYNGELVEDYTYEVPSFDDKLESKYNREQQAGGYQNDYQPRRNDYRGRPQRQQREYYNTRY